MILAKDLIDKAAERCGGQKELARRMGIDPADLSHLKNGKRPLSPELAAELADLSGENVAQAIADAIIERNKDKPRGAVLKEILGKALAAGVTAMWVFSYSADSIYDTTVTTSNVASFTEMHIVLSSLAASFVISGLVHRAVRRALRSASAICRSAFSSTAF